MCLTESVFSFWNAEELTFSGEQALRRSLNHLFLNTRKKQDREQLFCEAEQWNGEERGKRIGIIISEVLRFLQITTTTPQPSPTLNVISYSKVQILFHKTPTAQMLLWKLHLSKPIRILCHYKSQNVCKLCFSERKCITNPVTFINFIPVKFNKFYSTKISRK